METMETPIRAALDRFNAGDVEGYLALYTEDAVLHYLPPGLPGGVAGARRFYGMFLSAFPDLHVHVDDFIAEGARAVVRYTITGTHQGELMGIPASNKPVSVPAITILRFADGKCVERWSETDMIGLMTQIGAVPA